MTDLVSPIVDYVVKVFYALEPVFTIAGVLAIGNKLVAVVIGAIKTSKR